MPLRFKNNSPFRSYCIIRLEDLATHIIIFQLFDRLFSDQFYPVELISQLELERAQGSLLTPKNLVHFLSIANELASSNRTNPIATFSLHRFSNISNLIIMVETIKMKVKFASSSPCQRQQICADVRFRLSFERPKTSSASKA